MGTSFARMRDVAFLAVGSRLAYASMRLMEPWTGYEKVHGFRLLACNAAADESIACVRRALEALSAHDPATLTALQGRIRYILTVDEGTWSHQLLRQMRLLRWDISNLRATPIEEQLALLRGVAGGSAVSRID